MSQIAFAEVFPAPTWQQWRQAVAAGLKGASFEDVLVGRSADGFAIQPLYEKAGGAIVVGRRPRTPWHVTARVDHSAMEAAAETALAELEGGATSLALVISGGRFARGHGVTARTAAELDAVLAGVDLELIHLWLEPCRGASDAELVAALVAQRGLVAGGLDVDFGIDPLGEAAATGLAPRDANGLDGQLIGVFDRLRGYGFRGPVCRADGRSYHEAGASEAQELACVLATLVEYLRALERRGIALSEARAALSVAMAADSDQLLTIAKFRALRRLWDRVQRACGMAPAPIALHAESSWRMLTRRDPWVNILRGTIATFSAGVAGADSIATLPFDLALGMPDALARRIARNTQLILQHEAHLWRVVDPAAGSGGIEAMSDELCRAGWALFQQIERGGGMLQAVIDGEIGKMLQPSRQALRDAVATGRQPITGTSAFPNLIETKIRRPRVDEEGRAPTIPMSPHDCAVPILPSIRLSQDFEQMRDWSERAAAEASGAPRVFVAGFGERKLVTGLSAFAQNLFAAGGIAAIVEDGLDRDGGDVPARVVTRWRASAASLVCLCFSDELAEALPDDATHPTDTLAEAVIRRLRQAGVGLIAYAGDPGAAADALRRAGASHFLLQGCDRIALLDASLTAHSSWKAQP